MATLFIGALWISAAIACGGGSGATPTPTRNPAQPAICYQTVNVEDSVHRAIPDRISLALDDLNDRRDITSPPTSLPRAKIDEGCPSPAFHGIDERGNLGGLAIEAATGRLVDGPGYYSVFVYVLPDADLRDLPTRVSREEDHCLGDVCDSFTLGLYLSPSDLCDRDLLARALANALQLRGADPVYFSQPTPYYDAPMATREATPTPVPTPRCF
jgi:hypothetical protein